MEGARPVRANRGSTWLRFLSRNRSERRSLIEATSAARKLRRSVDGLARVIAVEYLTAARALDFRAPLTPSPATAAAVALLRRNVEGPGPDRHLAPEIEHAFVDGRSGALVAAVENLMGELA